MAPLTPVTKFRFTETSKSWGFPQIGEIQVRCNLLCDCAVRSVTAGVVLCGVGARVTVLSCSRQTLFDPAEGYVKDGQLTMRVQVRAVEGRSRDWGYCSRYSSKAATGMVGLRNQGSTVRAALTAGATCYMNSVLQTLFHTNALRRAVFRMPTEHDVAEKSVALALQVSCWCMCCVRMCVRDVYVKIHFSIMYFFLTI